MPPRILGYFGIFVIIFLSMIIGGVIGIKWGYDIFGYKNRNFASISREDLTENNDTSVGISEEGANNDFPIEVKFERLLNGQNADLNIGEDKKVIATKEDFQEFISNLGTDFTADTVNSVDFEKEQVLAVVMGRRLSGGYDVLISDIMEYPEYILVNVVYASPDKECATLDVQSNPYDVVKIGKTDKIIKFENSYTTVGCGS